MNKILLFSLASYVIGSISGSLLLGKLWNIDIRNFGSKSTGGTNAFRTVGVIFALLTFIIDLSKGLIPTYFIGYYSHYNEIEMMVGGFAAIIGHVYPVFHGFNGGKGAATLLGVLIILNPLSLAYILPTWIVILVFSGFVGLSTILAALALLIYSVIKLNINFQVFSFLVFLFILFTHRENIQRMIQKSENRFTKIMIFRRK